jgi:glycosyltransferase involved in cell wall biosynthesis
VRLDIVGHFGSRLSYATLTSEICRELRDAGILGRITNLDDSWYEPHHDLREHATVATGTHCFVVSEPRHYFAGFCESYGRARVAMYSSANTDRVAREHAVVLANVGRVFAPSQWSAAAVQHGLALHDVGGDVGGANITVLPLGVPANYHPTRERFDRLLRRCARNDVWTAVHFTSDFVWPGRKGTDELLAAWRKLPKSIPHKLIVHSPRAIYEDIYYRCTDLDLHDTVEIVTPEPRGSSDEDLLALYERADTVVLPTRAEGFGMMILASLCLGIPTVTTSITGQMEFLGDFGGWLSAPTKAPSALAYEEGDAPTIMVDALASVLGVAMTSHARRAMLADAWQRSDAATVAKWTWPEVRKMWLAALCGWMEAA